MKNFLFIILLCLLSVNSFADEFDTLFKNLNDCKSKYEKLQKKYTKDKFESNSAHTLKMIELGKNARSCYIGVGYDIIDKFYSDRQQELKQSLDNYVSSTNDISLNMYENTDRCLKIGGCGLLAQKFYIETTSHYIGSIVYDLIRGAKIMSVWGR